jgi:hypothetical protein
MKKQKDYGRGFAVLQITNVNNPRVMVLLVKPWRELQRFWTEGSGAQHMQNGIRVKEIERFKTRKLAAAYVNTIERAVAEKLTPEQMYKEFRAHTY